MSKIQIKVPAHLFLAINYANLLPMPGWVQFFWRINEDPDSELHLDPGKSLTVADL